MFVDFSLLRHKKEYSISWDDCCLSVKNGLSGIPFAKRHLELSEENPQFSLGHRIVAKIEEIPVLGGVAALVEWAIASLFLFLSPSILSSSNSAKQLLERRLKLPVLKEIAEELEKVNADRKTYGAQLDLLLEKQRLVIKKQTILIEYLDRNSPTAIKPASSVAHHAKFTELSQVESQLLHSYPELDDSLFSKDVSAAQAEKMLWQYRDHHDKWKRAADAYCEELARNTETLCIYCQELTKRIAALQITS